MYNKTKFYLGILFFLFFGCSKKFTKEYNDNLRDLNKFQTFIEAAKPPINKSISPIQKKYCKGADINFKDLAFRSLPVLLNKIYGVQINTNQNPDLQITINHLGICLEDLLDELVELYGIGYTKNNFGYNINVNTLKTKFFTINYHNFKRSGNSNTSIQGGSSLSNSSGSSGQANVQTQVEDNFWNNLADNISMLIGSMQQNNRVQQASSSNDDQPSFSIYKESGIVVVNAYPKSMKKVEKFINEVNRSCSQQINIEAKILEITLYDEFSTGIDWSTLQGNVKFQSLKSSMDPQNGIPSSFLAITSKANNTFAQTIQALSNQGQISVLSSPKISVLNNQKAVFKFGSDDYYITGITSATNNSSSSTTSSSSDTSSNSAAIPTLTALFSGISLDATPNITSGNQVIMHIHPTVTNINTENKSFTISGKDNDIPLASIETREADTVVKAISGDIIVVGGLMQNTVNLIRSGPKMKPSFFENLFGTKRQYREKKELVLLLRPLIVESPMMVNDFSEYLLEEEELNTKRPKIIEFEDLE